MIHRSHPKELKMLRRRTAHPVWEHPDIPYAYDIITDCFYGMKGAWRRKPDVKNVFCRNCGFFSSLFMNSPDSEV